MAIKKRLARSNIAMLVIPILTAAALTLLGSGGAIWLLAAGGMLCTKKYRRQGVTLLAGAVLGVAIGEAVYRAAGPRLRT